MHKQDQVLIGFANSGHKRAQSIGLSNKTHKQDVVAFVRWAPSLCAVFSHFLFDKLRTTTNMHLDVSVHALDDGTKLVHASDSLFKDMQKLF